MNVIMPQLGETVAEGKVASWFKSVGDKVAAGDNLFLIETDKVSMEVQATESGVLNEIRVAAGRDRSGRHGGGGAGRGGSETGRCRARPRSCAGQGGNARSRSSIPPRAQSSGPIVEGRALRHESL